jgi:hypothetical protein
MAISGFETLRRGEDAPSAHLALLERGSCFELGDVGPATNAFSPAPVT